jgi:hypothetical protein
MQRAISPVASPWAGVPAPISASQIWANLHQYPVDARGAFAAATERAPKAT